MGGNSILEEYQTVKLPLVGVILTARGIITILKSFERKIFN